MDIAKLILRLLDLAVVGALTMERAQALQAVVGPMLAEGRDPTPDEWAALRAQGVDLDARLDAAAAKFED